MLICNHTFINGWDILNGMRMRVVALISHSNPNPNPNQGGKGHHVSEYTGSVFPYTNINIV